MPSQAKAKKSPNGQPGRRNPKMRGSQSRGWAAKVLSEADHEEIIGELRRFTPLCMIAAKLNVSRHTLEKYVHATPALEREGKTRGYGQHVEMEHAEVPTFTFSRSGSKVQAEAEDAKT